jgi:hypothetical protein
MEPKGLLPHSQESSTCTYREPDQSSPYHYILSLQHSVCYQPTIYVSVSLVVSFLLTFLPINYMYSSSPTSIIYDLPISSPQSHHSNYTSQGATRYAAPCPQILCVPTSVSETKFPTHTKSQAKLQSCTV